ncbi:MAG: CemA family protein [Cyanobacteria bacterium RI_101]|nr:CemA family protein [Cyanobacteria bacterium RI_101]
MTDSPWRTRLDDWVGTQSSLSLDRAYQGALAIRRLEQDQFQGRRIEPDSGLGLGVYQYFKTDLDRELRQIRWNLWQFQTANLWLKNLGDGERLTPRQGEILERLNFIESVIGKYREETAPEFPLKAEAESLTEAEAPKSLRLNPWGAKAPSSLGKEAEEAALLRQFRIARQDRKAGIRFLILLVLVPLATQIFFKNVVYSPLVDHFKIHAVAVEEIEFNKEIAQEYLEEFVTFKESLEIQELLGILPENSPEIKREKLQEKAKEILLGAARRTQDGLKNVLADLTALGAFALLVIIFKKQALMTRRFISRSFLGLSDVTKVFIFILLTDVFVGFHSAEGWEVILASLMTHVGLTENRAFIFLFIATVPVLLDSLFKLLIFNYFTRQSPSAVAILEKMQK